MAKKEKEFDYIEIENARAYTPDRKKDPIIFFTLVYNDVKIYSCKIINGKKGSFISFPSQKGSDGNYYNVAYVELSSEEQDYIIKTASDNAEAN